MKFSFWKSKMMKTQMRQIEISDSSNRTILFPFIQHLLKRFVGVLKWRRPNEKKGERNKSVFFSFTSFSGIIESSGKNVNFVANQKLIEKLKQRPEYGKSRFLSLVKMYWRRIRSFLLDQFNSISVHAFAHVGITTTTQLLEDSFHVSFSIAFFWDFCHVVGLGFFHTFDSLMNTASSIWCFMYFVII